MSNKTFHKMSNVFKKFELTKAPFFTSLTSYMSPYDLLQLAQSCQLLKKAIFGSSSEKNVWQPHCEREFAAFVRLEEGSFSLSSFLLFS